jgi:uncharacterized protein (DUF1330 family)
MAVEPDQGQFEDITALAGSPEDRPMVMLNLNRYSDRRAYARYGAVASAVLERLGGKILWHAAVNGIVIGDQAYDDVIAVWYPSASAFLALATDPEILAARADRLEGLEQAALLRCDADPTPVIPPPGI